MTACTLQGVHMCVYSHGIPLLCAGHLLLAWGVIFDMMKMSCLYFLHFLTGVAVYVSVAHTHTAWGLIRCEPRTLEKPEEWNMGVRIWGSKHELYGNSGAFFLRGSLRGILRG